MTENPDRIERTLEVLLYAPIGIGMFLKDAAPTFVDMFVTRGRAEFDRRQGDVHQRVTTARSLGQVALAFGPPMLRQKVERTVEDARQRAEGLFGSPSTSPASSAPAPRAETPERPAPTGAATEPVRPGPGWSVYAADIPIDIEPASNGDLAASAALPIPGYDALSASQVVERLIGLAPDELDAVHAYESSHRQRRTILGKIEQLSG